MRNRAIFGGALFPTFSTVSVDSGHSQGGGGTSDFIQATRWLGCAHPPTRSEASPGNPTASTLQRAWRCRDRPDGGRRPRRDGARRIRHPQSLPQGRAAALSGHDGAARMAERRRLVAVLGRRTGPAARQTAYEALARRACRLAPAGGVRSKVEPRVTIVSGSPISCLMIRVGRGVVVTTTAGRNCSPKSSRRRRSGRGLGLRLATSRRCVSEKLAFLLIRSIA